MNIKKVIIYTLLIAVPSVFLIKWGIENRTYDSNKIPDINPNPTEKLRIFGKFPLDQNKYSIKASVRYIAQNPKCDNVIWLAGARFAQDENIDLNATMLNNHYELNIYHDYYKNGACDWQLGYVYLVTTQKDTNRSSYSVLFATKTRTVSASVDNLVLIQAKSPLNFVCNYEYHPSSDYTNYFCEDSAQNISAPTMNIFLPDSQKELEVNFQEMAESMKQTQQGEK